MKYLLLIPLCVASMSLFGFEWEGFGVKTEKSSPRVASFKANMVDVKAKIDGKKLAAVRSALTSVGAKVVTEPEVSSQSSPMINY